MLNIPKPALIKKLSPKDKKGHYKAEFWLLLIVMFALALRLWFFVGMEFFDDSMYLDYANKISKGVFVYPTWTWSARIGFYFPIALSFYVFGINDISASLFTLLSSLGSVVVIFYLGREFFGVKTGLLSAFLLSFFTLDILHSTTINPDIPVQFFIGLAFLIFIFAKKAEEKKRLGRSRVLYFVSGCLTFYGYLIKEWALLIIPFLFILYTFKSKKKISQNYLFFIIGILLIFSVENIYFFSNTGQWLLGEKTRQYALANDMNYNYDSRFYPMSMLNLLNDNSNAFGQVQLFSWLNDSIPAFGFFYYFIIIAAVYISARGFKNYYPIILWLVYTFIILEFGLHFFCTTITKCVADLHIRYLTLLSMPAMLILGYFLSSIYKNHKKIVSFFIFFLLITSFYYSKISAEFLKTGMDDIREEANYLKGIPEKKIYVPDGWHFGKIGFFLEYEKEKMLIPYECQSIDCKNPYYDKGGFIKDSYVIIGNPYSKVVDADIKVYPDFNENIPPKWKLLKTISIPSRGIFELFDPQIYYAP